MMKAMRQKEPKAIAILLFLLTFVPGAILMCHNMDGSILIDCLSERAAKGISVVFMTEIAGILAYIGLIGAAAFLKSNRNCRESRGERMMDEVLAGIVLILFFCLAVLLLYSGVVEPLLR